MKYSIRPNEIWKNSNEIYFDGMPTEKIRETLKGLKMRWNPAKKCWYGFVSEDEIKKALQQLGNNSEDNNGKNDIVIPEYKKVNEGSLYEGWQGGNNSRWATYDELKQLLMNDFKKAGIKATIKQNNAGYLTSITVTMRVKETEIMTLDEYIKAYGKSFFESHNHQNWFDYKGDNGKIQSIGFSELFGMNQQAENTKALIRNILETEYCYCRNNASERILKPGAAEKFKLMAEIVKSYNKDCSNSMIDYFDRDIYDHYKVKVVA